MRFLSSSICLAVVATLTSTGYAKTRETKVTKVNDEVLLNGDRRSQLIRCTEILEGYPPKHGEGFMCVSLVGEPRATDTDAEDEIVDTIDVTVDDTKGGQQDLKKFRNKMRHLARKVYRSHRKALRGSAEAIDVTPRQHKGIRAVYERIAKKYNVQFQVETPAGEEGEDTPRLDENGNPVLANDNADVGQDDQVDTIPAEKGPQGEENVNVNENENENENEGRQTLADRVNQAVNDKQDEGDMDTDEDDA